MICESKCYWDLYVGSPCIIPFDNLSTGDDTLCQEQVNKGHLGSAKALSGKKNRNLERLFERFVVLLSLSHKYRRESNLDQTQARKRISRSLCSHLPLKHSAL